MAMAQRQGHDPSSPPREPEDGHSSILLDDALYCEEDRFEEEEDEEEVDGLQTTAAGSYSVFPSQSVDGQPDSSWEEDDDGGEEEGEAEEDEEEEAELLSLLSKERRTRPDLGDDGCALAARREAVEWMLRVRGVYGFSALTAVLAVDYLDRFLSGFSPQRDSRPWMTQLVAVACLSLAAKVEETRVPLLLDLQVGDARFLFEAKTVQRMELLVLSTLGWGMHPVTPLSFVHHVAAARLGARRREFLRRCERLLVAAVSDSRSLSYLPSVLAAAAMAHVIEEVDPLRSSEHKARLLSSLRTSQEVVGDCCRFILEISETGNDAVNSSIGNSLKRKQCRFDRPNPRSPSGVVDASFSCEDDSNDSWVAIGPPFDLEDGGGSNLNPLQKRTRSLPLLLLPSPPSSAVQEKMLDLPFMSRRLFVGIVNGRPI
ncbi:cyclin-D3-1-like [Rhodamnia argentea]|uniref:Cyclin-D3-1-like n=1 Tax=Rhodamnia argentea TaxID=178133 RepID=A0A8B8QA17_9MYRT|nr:cyclin-D3-1-like [Rhodamnia argentea]